MDQKIIPIEIEMTNVFDFAEKVQIVDFETAIHYSKYGKFQTILLAICGTIYATCAISTTTLSFVLPSAECDFNLSSQDKGKLSATPLVGMILGCAIWGSIADCQGRKTAIMLSLLVDFVAAVASSFSGTFNAFLICRFFNGFGIIGTTSIIFSYLGEFASIKHRDKMLGRLEIFWNIGVILLPCLGWVLLSKIPTFGHDGDFSPWRIFVLVCSLPSLLSFVLLYFLPETPKFLISKQKYNKARLVFQKIYQINTGEPYFNYPVITLEGEYENNNNLKVDDLKNWKLVFFNRLSCTFNDIKTLFSQPYLKYLLITSFVDFGLMASYYTLIMWFPEIFERFNEFKKEHPNASASICTVSQVRTAPPDDSFMDYSDELQCDPTISSRVFIETIIIGLSCIPSSVSLSYFMNKVGKKWVLVAGLLLSGVATVALNWVQNATQTLILSCFFEALTSILEAVIFCVIVDLFPTNLRAIALAVTATSGRVGAIFGNVTFGLLIDLKCSVPIYLFGSFLMASGILCLGLPQSDKYHVLH